MIKIEINDPKQQATAIAERIEHGVKLVLSEAGIVTAEISVAVVDDQTIWRLNREYLQHDYATDVLSFLLGRDADRLDGEIIVSFETAAREAAEQGWHADHELLLYVVHGALHLVGHDDGTDAERAQMRTREQDILSQLGVEVLAEPRKHALLTQEGTQS